MKTYLVGGSVRDELLGMPVTDRDYVVVGGDPEQMVSLGFLPVGADFPVFLHPKTRDEYALARTERKTAPGYKGFAFHAAPDVTLEEDLKRRDLTINAMARGEDGKLIDPHGGQRDLEARVLRHVSAAFAEDPVRILRVARFSARFGFTIAPETLELMRAMVERGEADALVPERVWQEMARGLMERNPDRMIRVLRDCGALARVLPEIDRSCSDPALSERLSVRLTRGATAGLALPGRYALLVLDLEASAADTLAERINAPGDCRELARLAILDRAGLESALDAESTLALLERADAFRRPERIERLLEVAACDDPAGAAAAAVLIRRAVAAARSVDAGAVAREHPADIPGALRRARLAAIAAG